MGYVVVTFVVIPVVIIVLVFRLLSLMTFFLQVADQMCRAGRENRAFQGDIRLGVSSSICV